MAPNEGSTLQLPPGGNGLPLLGETLKFFSDPQFANRRHQQYGDIFRTNLLGRPTLFMRGVEANRFVLTNENRYFVMSLPPSTKALLGKLSLSLQGGGEHQSRRKLLAQAFMPRALSSYITSMEAITCQYTERWLGMQQLTWYPELRNYTLDIACKLLVGLDSGSQTELGHQFETWCQGLFTIPLSLPWTKFGRAKTARQRMMQEIERIIRDRMDHPTAKDDALSLLIQAQDDDGNRLSLEELKDQVLLLLFAGHETLTSAIASFCLLVAQHPQILERLRAEQQAFPKGEPLTLDTLKQMTYLDQALKEVLRIIPPVGGGFREVIEPCEFKGYQIPKGWGIVYQIASTHKMESLYPQPDQFNPDRFAQDLPLDQSKYGYVPFGSGIRDCLGREFARLEMKIFAVHLLRHYQWELLPDQDLEMVTIPTPHPKDGLRVKFSALQPHTATAIV